MFAALILVEVINEFAEKKEDSVVIFLDADKAFDRVWHAGLLCKLALGGIPPEAHQLITQW